MADAICSVVATACLDVCAGILLDFLSIRRSCTEHLFSCSCCPSCCRSNRIELVEDEEPEPGLPTSHHHHHHHHQQTTQQPQDQAPMQTATPTTK